MMMMMTMIATMMMWMFVLEIETVDKLPLQILSWL